MKKATFKKVLKRAEELNCRAERNIDQIIVHAPAGALFASGEERIFHLFCDHPTDADTYLAVLTDINSICLDCIA